MLSQINIYISLELLSTPSLVDWGPFHILIAQNRRGDDRLYEALGWDWLLAPGCRYRGESGSDQPRRSAVFRVSSCSFSVATVAEAL